MTNQVRTIARMMAFCALGLVVLIWYSPADWLARVLFESGKVDASDYILGRRFLFDFTSTLWMTMLAAALLFGRAVISPIEQRPPHATIAFRLIDVAWYLGAATAAAIAFAQIEIESAAPNAERTRELQNQTQERLFLVHKEAFAYCANDLPEISLSEASRGVRLAYDLIPRFCAEQDWESSGGPLFHEVPIETTCEGVAIELPPFMRGRGYRQARSERLGIDDGLLSMPEVFEAVSRVREFCYLAKRLDENARLFRIYSALERTSQTISQTEQAASYIRFVAVLIGLRLFRAIVESLDEVRRARRRIKSN
ncbi:hypothetical protein [Amaricoccus tamworthensis]|uniref:hypothetical protein n=1 Tax=Amaricoccus tamworthensis TaxID=57002 RepID=UPI003C7EC52B